MSTKNLQKTFENVDFFFQIGDWRRCDSRSVQKKKREETPLNGKKEGRTRRVTFARPHFQRFTITTQSHDQHLLSRHHRVTFAAHHIWRDVRKNSRTSGSRHSTHCHHGIHIPLLLSNPGRATPHERPRQWQRPRCRCFLFIRSEWSIWVNIRTNQHPNRRSKRSSSNHRATSTFRPKNTRKPSTPLLAHTSSIPPIRPSSPTVPPQR